MERIIGLDEGIDDLVIGCDPGPERCAMALVQRVGHGCGLTVVDAAYPKWTDFVLRGSGIPKPVASVVPAVGKFSFAYEKVTTRFGAVPGATTYDTCRNSGVALSCMISLGATAVYGLGTVDWRVAIGGRTNLKDSETRAALVSLLGEGDDRFVSALAKGLKEEYNLPKPIGCHLRDAVGVAVGAFLMRRHGTPVSAREVWHG